MKLYKNYVFPTTGSNFAGWAMSANHLFYRGHLNTDRIFYCTSIMQSSTYTEYLKYGIDSIWVPNFADKFIIY